jgi:hypothetical protein
MTESNTQREHKKKMAYDHKNSTIREKKEILGTGPIRWEPAGAKDLLGLRPPFGAYACAAQSASIARSVVVARRAALSARLLPVKSPELGNLQRKKKINKQTKPFDKNTFAAYHADRSDTSWTARAAKGRRKLGERRVCLRTATRERHRRPRNQRCKSGTSRGRSTRVADPDLPVRMRKKSRVRLVGVGVGDPQDRRGHVAAQYAHLRLCLRLLLLRAGAPGPHSKGHHFGHPASQNQMPPDFDGPRDPSLGLPRHGAFQT